MYKLQLELLKKLEKIERNQCIIIDKIDNLTSLSAWKSTKGSGKPTFEHEIDDNSGNV